MPHPENVQNILRWLERKSVQVNKLSLFEALYECKKILQQCEEFFDLIQNSRDKRTIEPSLFNQAMADTMSIKAQLKQKFEDSQAKAIVIFKRALRQAAPDQVGNAEDIMSALEKPEKNAKRPLFDLVRRILEIVEKNIDASSYIMNYLHDEIEKSPAEKRPELRTSLAKVNDSFDLWNDFSIYLASKLRKMERSLTPLGVQEDYSLAEIIESSVEEVYQEFSPQIKNSVKNILRAEENGSEDLPILKVFGDFAQRKIHSFNQETDPEFVQSWLNFRDYIAEKAQRIERQNENVAPSGQVAPHDNTTITDKNWELVL